MSIVRWIRRPLPHGGRRATLATVAIVVAAFAGPPLLPVPHDLQERLMFSGIGVCSLCLGLLRPPLFWQSGIMDAWREVLGDRAVSYFYVAIGLFFVITPFVAERSG